MREFDLLQDYPKLKSPRLVGENLRTIEHRIIASKRDKNFFDGDRNYGYGGFKYDGRWKNIAKRIIKEYNLNNKSKFLQIGSEKGFLLNDMRDLLPEIEITGIETSKYAVENSMKTIKENVNFCENYKKLNFPDQYFDFCIALGVVYTQTLSDAILLLKEISRVSKKNFITLASHENEEDYWLFKQWTLLGSIILKKEEWKKVMSYSNYDGDYAFTNSEKLNLQKKIN
tara:strand:+ start:716 stop:1399 length:684 start_codon:yes stop_codon:yes gene_type:complete